MKKEPIADLENSAVSAGRHEGLRACLFSESLLSQDPLHLPHRTTVSVHCISGPTEYTVGNIGRVTICKVCQYNPDLLSKTDEC